MNDLYVYFQNMIKLFIKLNLPISWKHPDGVEIYQNYIKKTFFIIIKELIL